MRSFVCVASSHRAHSVHIVLVGIGTPSAPHSQSNQFSEVHTGSMRRMGKKATEAKQQQQQQQRRTLVAFTLCVYTGYWILQLPDGRVLTFLFIRFDFIFCCIKQKINGSCNERTLSLLLLLAAAAAGWLNFIGGSDCSSPKKDIRNFHFPRCMHWLCAGALITLEYV